MKKERLQRRREPHFLIRKIRFKKGSDNLGKHLREPFLAAIHRQDHLPLGGEVRHLDLGYKNYQVDAEGKEYGRSGIRMLFHSYSKHYSIVMVSQYSGNVQPLYSGL